MKKILLSVTVLVSLSVLDANAQYVRLRPVFSATVSFGAPGPAPVSGAVWVGPEWAWKGNHYAEVPGYWARPRRRYRAWVPGHWKDTRRGYRWIPGHWQ